MWLDDLLAQPDPRALRPLDLALARFLRDRGGESDEVVLFAAALTSYRLGEGHACLLVTELPLSAEGSLPLLTPERLPALPWPATREAWQARLAASPLIATDAADTASPLVLAEDRLYLRRAWTDEQTVAHALRARLQPPPDDPPEALAAWRHDLDALFPAHPTGQTVDWQKVACAVAAASPFAIITGGPGTGKTTTVLRLLVLLLQRHRRAGQPPLRICLAAPTGKAAARLTTSLASQLDRLGLDAETRAQIPLAVTTVHRLLGMHPERRTFRHGAHRLLPADVVVIDEASMLDLEMTAALLRALPASARLILLGDRDQLASVEAGAILGDLCAGAEAGGFSPARGRWIQAVTGQDVTPWLATAAPQPLDQPVVMLRHSHRFAPDRGIGRLASALRVGDAAAADFAALAPEVTVVDRDQLLAGHDALARHVLCSPTDEAPATWDAWAAACLQVADGYRLLAAVREGEHGVAGLNAAVRARWVRAGWCAADLEWFAGRLVMITRNDPDLGLMNGDVGLVLPRPDPAGMGEHRLSVAFADLSAAGGVRWLIPARLPRHETAFAMTVHKSQGSEFQAIGVMLPDRLVPVLTRELLYTAVTRARAVCQLSLPAPAVWQQALQRRTHRHAGLRAALSSDR